MKRNPLTRFIPPRLALLVAPLLAAWPQSSRSADQEWSGASNGTWHTITNWTSGAGFPGDSATNTANEGTSADIMSIAPANTTGNIGINFTQLGGLSLGAIDVNKTNTTAVVIGNNSGTSGLLQLNGATVNGVPNTIIRCNNEANLTLNRNNISTNPGTLGLVLGTASGEIFVGQNGAATPALRTVTIQSIITEATAGNGFSKTGTGVLTLNAANSISGLVTVHDGSLRLQNPAAAGTSDILLRNADGAAVNNNDVLITGGLTYNNNITLENATNQNGRVRLQSTNTLNGGTNVWNGTVTFRSQTATGGNQALLADTAPMIVNGDLLQDSLLPSPQVFVRGDNASAPGTINGNILLGTGGFFKTDNGMWTVNSTGNTMGPVTVAAGMLVLNNNDALEPDSIVQMGQGSGTTARMQINTGFTQQLTGITSAVGSSSAIGHTIFGPGAIDFGAVARVIDTPDNTATLNELTIHAPITGSGGFSKNGAGNLIANGTIAGPVIVTAGGFGGNAILASTLDVQAGAIIGAGTATTSGTLTAAGVSLAAGTTIAVNTGTTAAGGSDLIANTGTLTSGGTTFQIIPNGSVSNGDIPLINYTGASPGTGSFSIAYPLLTGIGSRATAAVTDTGTAIGLNITGADKAVWTGATDAVWDIATTSNWKLASDSSATQFQQMDAVVFNDSGASTAITLNTTANPVRAEFTNTTAVAYSISGSGSLGNGALPSTMVLDKTGNGTVTLATANTYTGATNVTDGVLVANLVPGAATAAVSAIPTASPVNVSGSGVVRFGGDNTNATAVAVNVPHIIRGNGTVEHNPRMTAGQNGAVASTFTGNNLNFTGTLRLLSPASGTARLTQVPAAALGSATLDVQSGHQFYAATGQIYPNPITISGTGYLDTNGNLGALRLDPSANWTGPVTIAPGGARITSHNTSTANGGTVSGSITGGPLEVNVSNYNNSYTVFFTGSNSYSTTTIGGANTQTAGTPSYRLNIGTGGTTGTLGDGAVTINGDGANGVLGFDRSDGFTLKPGNTLTGDGSNLARTFIDFDCTGTGFANGGVAIDLGAPGVSGGQLRAGVSRASTLTTFTGSVEAGTLLVGAHNTGIATTNATVNVATGCNLAVTSISVCGGGSTQPVGNTAGAVLNFAAGSTVSVSSQMYAGDGVSSGGTININGDVSVGQQVRAGHWGSELSTINMNAGSLTLTGNSPLNSPSTSGAGSTTASGDNNINITDPATIVGGGIYLGIDGTGVLNHTGGTVTANWIVLDNRGNSTGGGDGIDRYNISGSSVLRLRSEWGIIARNATTEVSLGGGTIQLDNTGAGGPAGNTGPDLDVPLDAVLHAVDTTSTTLNTGGADNSFILLRNVSGTGTLVLAGDGIVELRSTGTQTISPVLTGSADLMKTGAGTAILSGSSGAYAGSTTVNEGVLRVDGTLGGPITVKSAATLAGSGTVGALTAENGGIVAPGASAGTLTAASADLQGGSRFDAEITGAATADKLRATGTLTISGTVKVILAGYVPVAGDTFDIADAATLSGTPAFDVSAAGLTAGLAWDTSAFLTDGTIKVISGGDPYTAWAAGFGLTGGKNDDDDADGASNLLEFATNAIPNSGGSGPRAFGKVHNVGGENVLTLTIAVRDNAVFAASGSTQRTTVDSVIYTVEATDDLLAWNVVVVTELSAPDSAAVQASLNLPALDAGWEWRTFRTDGNTLLDPRDMIRLSVAAQP
jgi:fibronectin-binding autotransporter adhesin